MRIVETEKPAPRRILGHPKCYAQALGDCTSMSREHWMPEAILERVEHGRGTRSRCVEARNLSFQMRDIRQSFGVDSLAGNILCKKHNNSLSPIDVGATKFFDAMEAVHYGCETPGAPEQVLRVDGNLLERFLLKVMIGGLFSGNLRHSAVTKKGVLPPIEWLKILFEGGSFPDRHGLYYVPAPPGKVIVADRDILHFSPFFTEDLKLVCGMRAWSFGIEFDLLLANLVPRARSSFDGALYRPAGLRIAGSSARIEFSWEGGARGGEILLRRI